MPSGHLERTDVLTLPRTGAGQHVGDSFLLLLRTPVLSRPHQEMRLGHLTGPKEGEHIRTPISDMDSDGLGFRAPDGLDLSHPDIGLALFPFESLMALFSLGSQKPDHGTDLAVN